MDALVRCSGSLALADVAGRPLLERQIQWLHAVGCDRIAVETSDAAGHQVRAWLAERGDALGPALSLVPATSGADVAEAIRAAGLSASGPVVIVPPGVLGDGDLSRALAACGPGGGVVHAPPPPAPGLHAASGAVRIWMPGSGVAHVAGPGWACTLRSADDAAALGWAALARTLPPRDDDGHGWPIEIHAAEISPGVWLARGAWVSPRARLVGPVLVGEGAVVDAHAVVGPDVVVGARAAVERGTILRETHVPPATMIGRSGARWSWRGARSILGAFFRESLAR